MKSVVFLGLGIVFCALAPVACDSSDDDEGTWNGTGTPPCDYRGRCPNTPPANAAALSMCQKILDSECRAVFESWFTCAAKNEACTVSGVTDPPATNASCPKEHDAALDCLARIGLVPPTLGEVGASGGFPGSGGSGGSPSFGGSNSWGGSFGEAGSGAFGGSDIGEGGSATTGDECGSFGFVGASAATCEACMSANCCGNKRACTDNFECLEYERCRATCSGETCQECDTFYPGGVALAQGLAICLQQTGACNVECSEAYFE